MATKPTPRVRVPTQAKPGELIEIKTLISHEMESGQRKDAAGKVVPRKIINKFTAAFNGKTVFEADWNPRSRPIPISRFSTRRRNPANSPSPGRMTTAPTTSRPTS